MDTSLHRYIIQPPDILIIHRQFVIGVVQEKNTNMLFTVNFDEETGIDNMKPADAVKILLVYKASNYSFHKMDIRRLCEITG